MKITPKQPSETNPLFNSRYQGLYHRALFVCSLGIARSPTSASLAAAMNWNTRSCGTEHNALIPLSHNLIQWANIIYFVNEYNYTSALQTFRHEEYLYQLIKEKAEVWDIPDEYHYMDTELVKIIQEYLSI